MPVFSIHNSVSTDKLPIINYAKGPLMVIAGPGTGKTMMIVWRVLKLILEDNIKPEKIWVTTFTRKAANELKAKISTELKKINPIITISNMLIGTIHSTCMQLIEENPDYFENIKLPIALLDENRQLLFFYKNYKKLGLPEIFGLQGKRPSIEEINKTVQHINWLNLFQINSDENKREISKKLNEKVAGVENKDFHIAGTYEKYQELLLKENFIDFPTILNTFYKGLSENAAFKKRLTEKIDYILIDEYQDINPIQQEIFLQIIDEMEEKNINIVGDDDQTIYQFRGAGSANLRDFQKKFNIKKDEIFKLKTNFRSPPSIINRYNRIILDPSLTIERFIKDINPNKKREKPDYGVIKISSLYLNDSVEKLVKFIKDLKSNNKIDKFGDIAILLRSIRRNHIDIFENLLKKYKIPYMIVGKSGIFSTDLGNQLLLYFGILKNDNFKLTSDFIEKTTFLAFSSDFKTHFKLNSNRSTFIENLLQNSDPKFKRDKKLITELKEIHRKCSSKLISILEAFYNYLRLAEIYSKDLEHKFFNEASILAKISSIILDFEEIYTNFSFKPFYYYISTLWYNEFADFPEGDFRDPNTIKIMTVHQAKGLEFPIVVIGEAIKKRFPVSKKKPEFYKNIECAKLKIPERNHMVEELKLFYVASSRPRDLLIINTAKKISPKDNRKNAETEWIKDIPSSPAKDLENLLNLIDKKRPIGYDFEYKEDTEIFSFSKLEYYKFCPFRYFILRELFFSFPIEDYFTLGTNIHAVIEEINRKILKNKKIQPMDDEIKRLIKNNWIDLPKSTQENENLIKSYIKPIRNYLLKNLPKCDEIYAVEEEFWISIDPRSILTGKIDLILKINDIPTKIVDFKLGGERSKDDTKYKNQLGTYIYLFQQANNILVKEASLYFIKGGEMLNYKFTQPEINKIEKDLKEILKRINNKEFKAKPNKEKCIECELNKLKVCPYAI